jgi:hypothetical protein
MVFVTMRENDCIKPFDSFAQHLLTKVRTGIDNKTLTVDFQMDRCPETFVAVIHRPAHLTFAPDDGHALGSAGAKERDFQDGLHFYFGLRKFFVELQAFLREFARVKNNDLEDVQYGIDLALRGEELIDNHDLLFPKQAVPGFKITFFVTQNVVRFGDQVFKFRQELVGVFDHAAG